MKQQLAPLFAPGESEDTYPYRLAEQHHSCSRRTKYVRSDTRAGLAAIARVAAKRATSQLRDVLKQIKDASHDLGRRDLTPAQKSEIEKLEASIIQRDEPPSDALTISDLEEQIDSLLRSHGLDDLWQLAADLARKNVKPEVLESLFASLDPIATTVALWLRSAITVREFRPRSSPTSLNLFSQPKELERAQDLVSTRFNEL